MNWIIPSLNWYFYLLTIGLIFLPITKRIFARWSFDLGYPFAKAIALIFLTYLAFVGGFLHILPFERISLFILLFLSLIINLYFFKKSDQPKKSSNNNLSLWKTILFEELLFLSSFIFWTIIRGQEGSIRGLEKFMDFGFINSILRSRYFPPLDMWLAGHPINYYYFGHLSGAFLIKLTNTLPNIGYNLILSTLFALGITQVFSLCANICLQTAKKIIKSVSYTVALFIGLLGTLIVNLGGNLHTIYLFTKGYPNDNPIPFWQILSGFNLAKYWYPNATRFIPFTIHEFPVYSYVVADLHGHVFDIPFILLTLAVLFNLFTNIKNFSQNHLLLTTVFLGFLTAIHYMTNAFDGPIYILLSIIVLFLIFNLSVQWVVNSAVLISSFFIFSLPFSLKFQPFVTGIGVNCSPDFLVEIGKIGPFLFEKDKCQSSPPWMLFILWGFFWVSFLLLAITRKLKQKINNPTQTDNFILLLFFFGTFLIIVPEFFYIKDIYPAHFRANTMFKLGYQAFIMMGIGASYVFFRFRFLSNLFTKIVIKAFFLFFFFFVIIYPFFAIVSYYGNLSKPVVLDGSKWFETYYPEDKEIIDYLNKNIKGQPVVAEAQGDSYTDYERISAYTGLPTVAGWWVHEWLWRGSSDVVGKKIPEIIQLYESNDLELTKQIVQKYQIKYIVISELEKQKYKNINERKFSSLGKLIFRSSNSKGALYQLNQ